MTLLVRDEEELLETNLEYHFAQGVEFVIATDHGSTDSTPAILRRYEQAGVARVFRVDGPEHHQSRRVTRMARLAAVEYRADWVINNDGDEFWWPAVGSLADVFAAIPDHYGQITARRNNFLPCPVQDGGAFYERFVIRERASLNRVGRLLEPKVAHRGRPDVIVAPGNHEVRGRDLAPVPCDGLIEVLHFPMRTPEQFERKILATGIGYESLPFRGHEVGRDQLELLELQRRGQLTGYFAEQVLSDEQIADGLRSGALVRDRRLAGFMAECKRARSERFGADSVRPDSDTARTIVAQLLSAARSTEADRDRGAEQSTG
jgi:hypothetical protein